jgi:hypothetical protein
MTADEETKKKIAETKDSRKWKVGLATVAGATIIGVTGGMAAPLVAAGVGSVMGGLGLGATAAAGYLGSVAGSTLVVGSLFGAFGGRITGQMMDNYAKEVEDFAFIPVHSSNKTSENHEEGAKEASDHDHKLRVTICISGWLTDKEEVVKPWTMLGTGAEVFAMRYELEALLNLGHSMDGLVKSAAWGAAQKQAVASTMFADLAAALWPIALTKVARVIDNPFSVAMSRSDKAGEVLADALINKAQGERPVSLIGYSLGARVIYTCLTSLAKRKAFGLVENVVMMGAPTPADTSDWRILRSVVSGRLVNVYSDKDRVLGFMYRGSSLQYGVAGLQPIEGLTGVENVDVSTEVSGHLQYRYLTGDILQKIGFKDIDMETVEQEHVAMEKMEKTEKEESKKSQRKQLQRRNTNGGKTDEAAEGEHEANELQKTVAANTQKSLKARIIEWWLTPNVPSAKDAEKLANNMAGNAKKIAQDPTKAGAVAGDVVGDVQSSTESYAQWAMRKLPSMPGTKKDPVGGVKKAVADPSKAIKDASNLATNPTKAGEAVTGAAKDVQASTESYTQWAVNQLPSLRSTSKIPAGSVPTPAADASKAVGEAPKALGRTVSGLQKSAADPSKAASGVTTAATDAAKGVQKTITDPSRAAENVSKVASDTTKTAQGYASYLPSIPGMSRKQSNPSGEKTSVPEPAKGTAEIPKTPGDITAQAQSYVSSAASFLPSGPTPPIRGKSLSKSPTLQRKESTPKATDAVKNSPSKASDAAKSGATSLTNATAGVTKPLTDGTRSLATKSSDVASPTKKMPSVKKAGDAAGSMATNVGKSISSTANKSGEQATKNIPGAKAAGDAASKSVDSAGKAASSAVGGLAAGASGGKRASDAASKSIADAGQSVPSTMGKVGAKAPVPKVVGDSASSAANTAGKATSSGVGKATGAATSAGGKAAGVASSTAGQATSAFSGLTSSLAAPLIPDRNSSAKKQVPSTPTKARPSASSASSTPSKHVASAKSPVTPVKTPPGVRSPPAKLSRQSTPVKTPQVKTPVKTPQIKSPLAKSPQIKSPQAKSPQVKSPQVKSPQVKSPPVKSPQAKSPQVESLHVKGPPRKDSASVVKRLPAAGVNVVKSAPGVAGAGLQQTGAGALNVAKKGGDVGVGAVNTGGSAVKAGGKGLGKLGGLVGFGKKK